MSEEQVPQQLTSAGDPIAPNQAQNQEAVQTRMASTMGTEGNTAVSDVIQCIDNAITTMSGGGAIDVAATERFNQLKSQLVEELNKLPK